MLRKLKIWILRQDLRGWERLLRETAHPGARLVICQEIAKLKARLAVIEYGA